MYYKNKKLKKELKIKIFSKVLKNRHFSQNSKRGTKEKISKLAKFLSKLRSSSLMVIFFKVFLVAFSWRASIISIWHLSVFILFVETAQKLLHFRACSVAGNLCCMHVFLHPVYESLDFVLNDVVHECCARDDQGYISLMDDVKKKTCRGNFIHLLNNFWCFPEDLPLAFLVEGPLLHLTMVDEAVCTEWSSAKPLLAQHIWHHVQSTENLCKLREWRIAKGREKFLSICTNLCKFHEKFALVKRDCSQCNQSTRYI